MKAAPPYELLTLFTASTLSLHALLPIITHCLEYNSGTFAIIYCYLIIIIVDLVMRHTEWGAESEKPG